MAALAESDSVPSMGKKPKARSLCSVSVVSPLEMDLDTMFLFELWLDGVPEEEMIAAWEKRISESDRRLLHTLHLQTAEVVRDALAEFSVLTHHLARPFTFVESFSVQISPALLEQLILRFYRLDEQICRGLIGKKLKPRATSRRRPEDVAAHTQTVANRVLYNVQQVYEYYVESRDSPKLSDVPVVRRFSDHFLFPLNLSAQYARLLFLVSCRFDLTKKRLAYLRMQDLDFIAHVMLTSWCSPSTIVLDADFLQQLRRKPDPDEIPVDAKHRIPTPILKAMVRIGQSLSSAQSSLFSDLNEKVLEHAREDPPVDYAEVLGSAAPMKSAWGRYFKVIGDILNVMARRMYTRS